MPSYFTKHLLQWHSNHPRPLPWDDGPRDAYHIWISEIIMQQTRIEQGAPYYLRFVDRFPSVESLAEASVDEVLRYWQGLGYYSRARNLHKAARFITGELHGVFPRSLDELLKLPGIGPYSAAAISSFAYGLAYPVVDGNVKRVITRFLGITTSIDDVATHEQVRLLAAGLMSNVSPAVFNQAIMNFGAVVCKPKNPECISCSLVKKCFAYQNDMVGSLPVRTKKKSNALRHFHFIVIRWKQKILLQRRETKDIWQGLYTPPVIEKASSRSPHKAQVNSFVAGIIGHGNIAILNSTAAQHQLLSHQTISGRFHHLNLLAAPGKTDAQYVWVSKKTIHDYARPKMIVAMSDDLY